MNKHLEDMKTENKYQDVICAFLGFMIGFIVCGVLFTYAIVESEEIDFIFASEYRCGVVK